MSVLAPDSPYRNGALVRVNARYEAFLAAGYPVVLEGVAETLQCRTELDRTNWLTLIDICKEVQRAADLLSQPELMDAPIPVGIRCTSNRSYTLSFADCLELLQGLRAWAAAAQANWWRLKDATRHPDLTREQSFRMDLEAGWP